jgi:hypothetical protein
MFFGAMIVANVSCVFQESSVQESPRITRSTIDSLGVLRSIQVLSLRISSLKHWVWQDMTEFPENLTFFQFMWLVRLVVTVSRQNFVREGCFARFSYVGIVRLSFPTIP